MLYLNDKYLVGSRVITALSSCFDRVKMLSKNDSPSQQCFLSCTANTFNRLAQKTPQKIIVQSFQVIDNIGNNEKNYRAVDNHKVSFSSNLDGISGPNASQKPQYILGIDPGNTGALAVIEIAQTPIFVGVYDFPTYVLKAGNKNRKRLDLVGLSVLLDTYSNSSKFALIEDVASMPGDGHVGAFSFGFATGAVHGALVMAGIKIEKVRPSIWKASLGLDADKSLSIKLAIKLFPESSKHLKRKQDHGRAEAILLAWFAWKNMRKV